MVINLRNKHSVKQVLSSLGKAEPVSESANRFLFNGGYSDRLAGLSPQQWSDRNYRAGYSQAICDSLDSKAYQPVEY